MNVAISTMSRVVWLYVQLATETGIDVICVILGLGYVSVDEL